MMIEFEMTNLEKIAYFLGMEDCNLASTPTETNLKIEPENEDEDVDPTLFR